MVRDEAREASRPQMVKGHVSHPEDIGELPESFMQR